VADMRFVRRLAAGAEVDLPEPGTPGPVTVTVMDLPKGGQFQQFPFSMDGGLYLPHPTTPAYDVVLRVDDPEVARRLSRALLNLHSRDDDADGGTGDTPEPGAE